jgi:arylsulfatase A-like enzyme
MSSLSRMRRKRLVPLLILAAAMVGWWSWILTPRSPRLTGVVIITLDTTRADHLTAYGYMDAAMPHLDRLAQGGSVFDRAISVAPLTLPAHASLFTGLYPSRHGVHDNVGRALAPHHTTLAELLRAQGFRTGAFVGSIVLDRNRGLAQGFEQYTGVRARDTSDPRIGQRRADAVVDDAIRWLDGVDGRFLLWTHLYDPHRPYDPPDPFRSVSDPYVGEIAFADSQIGRLLQALERRGRLDQTLVIVAGDHGESLGEHGERDHGAFLYESVLRVPLVIRAPGIRSARIGAVVRLVDLMPTVLDFFGMMPPRVDGVSLTDLMRGRKSDLGLEAYAESRYPILDCKPLRSMRDARFKVIDAPHPELYDLDADPFEMTNLYDERQPLADAMLRRLRSIAAVDIAAQRFPTATGPAVPPDLVASLSALGYAGARQANGMHDAVQPSGSLPICSQR